MKNLGAISTGEKKPRRSPVSWSDEKKKAESEVQTQAPSRTSKRTVRPLVDQCVAIISMNVFQFSKEDFWAMVRADCKLKERFQRHLCRMTQIKRLRNYKSWHEDGKQLELEEDYDEQGRKHGRCIYWHPDGRTSCQLAYRHGQPDGPQHWYGPSGELTRHCLYEDGLCYYVSPATPTGQTINSKA